MNFDKLKSIWEKYNPNSGLTDAELSVLLNQMYQQDPKFDLEGYLKTGVWRYFKQRYPLADLKSFRGNRSMMIMVFTINIPRLKCLVIKSIVIYALGLGSVSFPRSLLLTQEDYPIPGTPFSKTAATILNEFTISVGDNQYFLAKFRDIFQETTLGFTSASQSRRWLGDPNFNYCPQQLNFAVWCATSGCGISLNEDYPKRLQEFIHFHIYFTVRRILYELVVPLPGESIFKQIGNRFDKVAFPRCAKNSISRILF